MAQEDVKISESEVKQPKLRRPRRKLTAEYKLRILKEADKLSESSELAVLRTMYRILNSKDEVRERRNLSHHGKYQKPELLASAPNQVWSWDITKLLGPEKWTYFYLYVLMDIFSRYVVGWMLADQESSSLGKLLIETAVERQGVTGSQLTVHSDRGGPMTGKPVAHLLADLGITKSLNRPQVSNDNPFSEAQFKTLKYSPGFPERFGCKQDAEAFSQSFFRWYNYEHKHGGIGYFTPASVHYGKAEKQREIRQKALQAAYLSHPERFVMKPPEVAPLHTAVWINPPLHVKGSAKAEGTQQDTLHQCPRPEGPHSAEIIGVEPYLQKERCQKSGLQVIA